MTRGYDGSLKIDTKIEEGGFNKGIRNLGGKVKELGMQMAATVGRMLTGFAKVVGIVTLIAFAVTRLIRSIVSSVNQFMRIGQQTEAVKADFDALRASVRNAFLPLLHVALPLLQRVAQWLTNIFNIIGMVIGALTGQTQVMRATASAAGDAAGGAGKMAKNTKEAEKAAKGALAAFDEINVLEVDEPISADDIGDVGGGGGADMGGFEMVPISEKILEWVNKVKAFLEPLKAPLLALWEALKGLWEAAKRAFEPWFEWLEEQGIMEFLRDLAVNGIEWLTERIKDLTKWIDNNQKAFRTLVVVLGLIALAVLLIVSPTALVIAAILAVIAVIVLLITYWPQISAAAVAAWEWIKNAWKAAGEWFKTKVWEPITNWAATALNNIGKFFVNIWNSITNWSATAINNIGKFFVNLANGAKTIINNIGQFFVSLWSKVTTGWSNFFKFIGDGFKKAFDGVVSVVKSAINVIIGFVNGMMSAIAAGINLVIGALNSLSFTVPDWVPLLGGSSFGFNIAPVSAPQIPLLAKGAVIPPNSQFLAVLGDQRSGRNLELPEGLMRQIVREELEGMDMGGGEVTINFAGSLGALVRELKPYIEQEDRRMGMSLARGA